MALHVNNLLEGKISLITGCSRGIGKEIAKAFLCNGSIVYANARNEQSIESLLDEIPKEYIGNIRPIYFDVNDSEKVKQAFLRINTEQKRLDCLVNNAGIMKDAILGMVSKQLLQDIFNTNVFAVVDIMQYAIKLMNKQKSGSIINISSIVGTNGNPGQIAYSASKGAIISITKTASKELASNNIRVNAIAPGMINTDMLNSIGPVKLSELKSKIGFNRLGSPEDIANLSVFLASDMSSYISGQIIGVDGVAVI